MYSMNGNVMLFMETCTVYILLHQSFNKNNFLPVVTNKFFLPVFIYLFVCQQVFRRNLKVSREYIVTRVREKSCKENIFQPWNKKNWKYFITPKWVRRKEKIGIFMKQELKKNINNKSAHMTFQTRLWWQECLLINLEGLRKILNTHDSVPFNAVTELSMGNIKKACECF